MSPEEPWPIMPEDPPLPDLQVPPTRPPTPTLEHRFERIAEAPSRADHYLPLVETSSPIRAVTPITVAPLIEKFDRVTLRGPHYEDMAQDVQDTDPNGHAGSAPSDTAPPATDAGPMLPPNRNVILSSCDHRYYVPTPYNSPVRRNTRAASASESFESRLRGGGSAKRSAASPKGAAAKKSRGSTNGMYKRKDLLYDDADTLLADGNSPLYNHANLLAILQHPLATATLEGSEVGSQLQKMSQDALRTAITEFLNNGRNGYNDPGHLSHALAAVESRASGEFDDFLEEKFKETWADKGDEDMPTST